MGTAHSPELYEPNLILKIKSPAAPGLRNSPDILLSSIIPWPYFFLPEEDEEEDDDERDEEEEEDDGDEEEEERVEEELAGAE